MEQSEKILSESRLMKRSADEIHDISRNVSRYRSEVGNAWKGSDHNAVDKEIENLGRRLDRIAIALEELSKNYLKYGQMTDAGE